MSTRDEYVEQMKAQLDKWNAELDQIEERAAELQGEARENFDKRQSQLRDQMQQTRDKFNELQQAGVDRWDNLRGELDHLRKALVQSFNYFKSQV